MSRKLDLSDAEREARRLRMKQLNASGRRGTRRAKTDEERIRESLGSFLGSHYDAIPPAAAKRLHVRGFAANFRPRQGGGS